MPLASPDARGSLFLPQHPLPGNNAGMRMVLPAIALLFLAGCGWFNFDPPPPGEVSGVIMYDGQPEAGKRLTLYGSGMPPAISDANGRYTFTGVKDGIDYHVLYTSDFSDTTIPNEVATWDSKDFVLSGSGVDVAPFDVAYNGLLYPDIGMSLIITSTSPVPFHWSTHPQAQEYRLHLSGPENYSYVSNWTYEPTAVVQADIAPGSYTWKVEIDGGDAGSGMSR